MKTTKMVKSLFGAVLPLLVFASTNGAMAQTERIAFTVPVSIQISVKPARYTNTSQIFTMNSDGSDVTQLTSSPYSSVLPAWSPDHQYIAYIATGQKVSGGTCLMVMRADGSGSFAVAPASDISSVDWSPDGTYLIYANPLQSPDGKYQSTLFVVPVDPTSGTVGTPTVFAAGGSYDPSWSPDGTKVAFDRYPAGGGSPSIIVRDVTTGDEYDFSSLVSAPNSWMPRWSPDGTMLAFKADVTVTTTTKKGNKTTTTTATNPGVFIAYADGSGLLQVTPSGFSGNLPSWSPDGSSLAFVNGGSPFTLHKGAIYTTVLDSGVMTYLCDGTFADWNP